MSKGGLTLAGCQVPTKLLPHFPSSTGQDTHQLPSLAKRTQLEESSLIYG